MACLNDTEFVAANNVEIKHWKNSNKQWEIKKTLFEECNIDILNAKPHIYTMFVNYNQSKELFISGLLYFFENFFFFFFEITHTYKITHQKHKQSNKKVTKKKKIKKKKGGQDCNVMVFDKSGNHKINGALKHMCCVNSADISLNGDIITASWDGYKNT